MSTEPTCNKSRLILIVSAALNLFLLAFLLGRLSIGGMAPPPPPPPGAPGGPGAPAHYGPMGVEAHMPAGPGGPGAMRADMPVPPPGGPMTPPLKAGMMPPAARNGAQPSPGAANMSPVFFNPTDLFTPEELKNIDKRQQDNFEQAQKLKAAFTEQLKTKGVTKQEAVKYFSEQERLMTETKLESQSRAAKKLSTLTPEERQKLFDSAPAKK